jgi:hypothetical protein
MAKMVSSERMILNLSGQRGFNLDEALNRMCSKDRFGSEPIKPADAQPGALEQDR